MRSSNKKTVNISLNKPLSKGERKGWKEKDKYVAVPLNSIRWESKKIEPYPTNRYGLPKLVP